MAWSPCAAGAGEIRSGADGLRDAGTGRLRSDQAHPRARRKRPQCAGGKVERTPIVALTAHALADIRQQCLEAGMDDFLTKPFDEAQMTEALHRWIGHLRAHPRRRTQPDRRAATCRPKPVQRRKAPHRLARRSTMSARSAASPARRCSSAWCRASPASPPTYAAAHAGETRRRRSRGSLAHRPQPEIQRRRAGRATAWPTAPAKSSRWRANRASMPCGRCSPRWTANSPRP